MLTVIISQKQLLYRNIPVNVKHLSKCQALLPNFYSSMTYFEFGM